MLAMAHSAAGATCQSRPNALQRSIAPMNATRIASALPAMCRANIAKLPDLGAGNKPRSASGKFCSYAQK